MSRVSYLFMLMCNGLSVGKGRASLDLCEIKENNMIKFKISSKLILCVMLILGAIESDNIFPQVISEKSIMDIEIIPTQQPIIFASTIIGQLFRSQDSGNSWQEVSLHLHQNPIVTSLTFVVGMKVSKNTIKIMGQSKKQLPAGIEKPEGTLLAATKRQGLFYSKDLGAKWSPFPSTGLPENASITDMVTDAKGRIFIGTERDGVFRLKDGKYENMAPTISEIFEVKHLVVSPRDFLTLYAVVPHGIYALTKTREIILLPYPYGTWLVNESEKWEPIAHFKKPIVNTMLVDPTNHKMFYVGSSNGLLHFDFNKKTTKKILPNKNVTAVAFSKPSILLVGTEDGLLFSLNKEKNWIGPDEFIIGSCKVTVLKNSPSLNTPVFAGTGKGIYISKNNGSSWKLIHPGYSTILAWFMGIGLLLVLLLFVYTIIRFQKKPEKQKNKQKKMQGEESGEQKAVSQNFSDQIQEAFDSLKCSELPIELFRLNKPEKVYVDYRKNLESLLQERNDYIVGYHGAGKTLIFSRAFLECVQSWEKSYPDRHKQFINKQNVLAVYLSLKEFELAGFSYEDNSKKIEKQFIQAFIKSMLDQTEKYPSSLRKQIKKLFANKIDTQSTNELLAKIHILLDRNQATMIYLFLDDFSVLNSDLQMTLDTIFRNIILSNKKIYLKLAVVPEEYNLGEIEPQRDMMEFSLDINDIVNNASQPEKARQEILEISYEIINRRLNFYTDGRFSFDDIVSGNCSEIIRVVFNLAGGVPRTMGLILSQSWRLIVNSGRYSINKSDLWQPKSSFK